MSWAGKEEAAEGRREEEEKSFGHQMVDLILCVCEAARFKWETCVNMRLKKGGHGRGEGG